MAAVPIRMVRSLADRPPDPVWPAGIRASRLAVDDAVDVHALLTLCYAEGGGEVGSFAEWRSAVFADPEFDPNLCFLARAPDGDLAGFAQCWTTAFVKDLAVHPAWRRHGLGRALMLSAFSAFRRLGAESVALKVEPGNAGALAFYRSLGMRSDV